MSDNIALIHLNESNALHVSQNTKRFNQAGLLHTRKIYLRDITRDDHLRIHTHTR